MQGATEGLVQQAVCCNAGCMSAEIFLNLKLFRPQKHLCSPALQQAAGTLCEMTSDELNTQ